MKLYTFKRNRIIFYSLMGCYFYSCQKEHYSNNKVDYNYKIDNINKEIIQNFLNDLREIDNKRGKRLEDLSKKYPNYRKKLF